jgi:GMP synthase (glutamine-hydrolysing)
MARETVLILDFGSQYTQLIARRVREQGVFSEVIPGNTAIEEIRRHKPAALILSGSPASGYRAEAPMPDPASTSCANRCSASVTASRPPCS